MAEARHTVGIDLGTTNCVLASWEAGAGGAPDIRVLAVPQVTDKGAVAPLPRLPSFLYAPLEAEAAGARAADWTLPWPAGGPWVAGAYARERGGEVPGRFVSSAKSWLCLRGSDRRAAALPFGAAEGAPRISPLEASAHYLRHLASAWEAAAGAPLSAQSVLLTVPASFDEEARRLTEEAAHQAGIRDLTLIEEPLAALYAWVNGQGEAWRKALVAGDTILVCDVGGGTTDFSLVAVRDEGGRLGLERVAVGEHILLGGDNMDLTLAYHAKARLEKGGAKVNATQLRSLWFQARRAKEDLLSGAKDTAALTVLGAGSRLIAGTLKAEFTAAEAAGLLVDGFFPACGPEDWPAPEEQGGLQEVGLPFARDPAVTKHLARFLGRHPGSWPTKVLFNGGVFHCAALRERVLAVLGSWAQAKGLARPLMLAHTSLDEAVAVGAACYGWARTGKGIRIRAGVSRSYYVRVEGSQPAVPGLPPPAKALCVAPFGMEEGEERTLGGSVFALAVGRQARFRFLSSTVRTDDQAGTVLEDWGDELEECSPMEVSLPAGEGLGDTVPVTLGARVTETGALKLFFTHAGSGRSWQLEYSLRGG